MSTTITMSLKEYEAMKRKIDRLQKESIYNFSEKEYEDFASRPDHHINIDTAAIVNFMKEQNPKAKAVVCKDKSITNGLTVQVTADASQFTKVILDTEAAIDGLAEKLVKAAESISLKTSARSPRF